MPKFKFRLATLLKLREAARDERQAELSEAYRADDILNERLRQIHDELAALSVGCRKAAGPGAVNIDLLIESQRYEVTLRVYEKQTRAQRERLALEIERRREALLAANREVKVLEKLREQQLERHREEENRRDVKRLDEVAQRRAAAAMAEAEA
ncbi:MAG: flagellar export protein FliJ [Pirellulales bacterium]|nr:flagellar export protein FliJ [Pirellulales bacterium]